MRPVRRQFASDVVHWVFSWGGIDKQSTLTVCRLVRWNGGRQSGIPSVGGRSPRSRSVYQLFASALECCVRNTRQQEGGLQRADDLLQVPVWRRCTGGDGK